MSAEREPGRQRMAFLQPALRLAIGALLAVALLQGLVEVTREPIAAAQQVRLNQRLSALLPADPASAAGDQIELIAPHWLGSQQAMRVYRRDDAMVIETIAADGYAGPIRLLVGLGEAGQVTAVRVTEHRETPGLGDAIEAEKSDWILQFDDRSVVARQANAWRVDKDGGDFDTLAGATVTSRAVVQAVERVALLHANHYAEIRSADEEKESSR